MDSVYARRVAQRLCHNCAHGAHYHCDGYRWTVTLPLERVVCECTGGPHYDPVEW